MPGLDRDGDVFLLDLGDGENRWHPDWMAAVGEALDEVEAAGSPRALVTTATGKHWSLGLDLDWLGANPQRLNSYLDDVHALLARMLALSVPAVAAVTGHAFAAGAMIALAHDFRVMRVDRGFFCLPEVDLGMPFTPGMSALITARLAPQVAHEAMTTGRRYGGASAMAAGIVDVVTSADQVVGTAVERARRLVDKPPETLGAIKDRLYAPVLAALRDAEANRFGP